MKECRNEKVAVTVAALAVLPGVNLGAATGSYAADLGFSYPQASSAKAYPPVRVYHGVIAAEGAPCAPVMREG
jgi:hypothetical protein